MLSVSREMPESTVRLIRRKHGSLRKLATAVGKDHGTVSRTLRGELKSEATQKALAKALGVSRPKLFGSVAA